MTTENTTPDMWGLGIAADYLQAFANALTGTGPTNEQETLMRIATANIQDNPDLPRRDVIGCGVRLGKRVGIVGFQELAETQDHTDILTGLHRGSRNGEWRLTDRTQCAIGYRSDIWTLVNRSSVMGTKGIGGITPDLPIVTATFRGGSKTFAVVNTHMVPLSLHGKRRPDFDHRMNLWMMHAARLRDQVQNLKRQRVTVFVTGDFNNLWNTVTVDSEQRIIAETPLDKIILVPGSVAVRVTARGRIATPSDHDAVAATVKMWNK